ncbi:hypothetical protein CSA56_18945 [candidate division KSB3 bacterium]|uniref:Uncharacterized protein n=1 Tax=candidate division KSB3 bacterium TaxID=2044937 RepID=A0A2G6K8Y3_9BACT|nr:MAG: hypothetical protein CSA56_18945 [candidate division KSB3 bacterium]
MENNSIVVEGNTVGTIAAGNTNSTISTQIDSAVISALPHSSAPQNPGIKELLSELQKAIQGDSNLPDADKKYLLGQVNALAEAKQEPELKKKEDVARKAKKIFAATLESLPATAKIVESCNKLLPMIMKLIGLP